MGTLHLLTATEHGGLSCRIPNHAAGKWQSWDLNLGPLSQDREAAQQAREGKVLPGSPCDFMPHFCFLPSVLSTQEAWRRPPLTVLSAAGWTWGPGPTSCVVQDVAFPSWNQQLPQGMGAVNARSYQSQAWPRPPPLPFTPLSALSKRLGGSFLSQSVPDESRLGLGGHERALTT